MKKILLAVLVSILVIHNTYAVEFLKPNLLVQMKKQEVINKENKILERKLNNQMRLAEIRSRKYAERKTAYSNNSTNQPTSQPAKPPIIQSSNNPTISWVDMNRVRSTWIGWYNSVRSDLGLGAYVFDARLDVTAHSWNIEFAKGKWQNHHRRNPGDSYYDFPVIDAWFIARGINPKVIDRAKHTENVGYGYYSCSDSDCTDELISSIRGTFNFFMSEKWKAYDAHYRSIVQPYFTKIGMDIIVVPSEKRYYITIHYITE